MKPLLIGDWGYSVVTDFYTEESLNDHRCEVTACSIMDRANVNVSVAGCAADIQWRF